ncbi:MAG: prepilin-type N-terminal cleavage/methylation domain-containing protein, partial [Verrucomicrobiota bacterium]
MSPCAVNNSGPFSQATRGLFMQYISRRQTSFTLIEILAVIAIVVIVAGIVIGGAGAAQRKAAEAKAR